MFQPKRLINICRIKIHKHLKFSVEADSPPLILLLIYIKEELNEKSIKYFAGLKV